MRSYTPLRDRDVGDRRDRRVGVGERAAELLAGRLELRFVRSEIAAGLPFIAERWRRRRFGLGTPGRRVCNLRLALLGRFLEQARKEPQIVADRHIGTVNADRAPSCTAKKSRQRRLVQLWRGQQPMQRGDCGRGRRSRLSRRPSGGTARPSKLVGYLCQTQFL